MKLLNDREIDKFYGEDLAKIRWESQNLYEDRRRNYMSVKKDCFAYRIGRCNILTEMVCKRDTCSFYKTHEEMEQDRARYGFLKDYKPREKQE